MSNLVTFSEYCWKLLCKKTFITKFSKLTKNISRQKNCIYFLCLIYLKALKYHIPLPQEELLPLSFNLGQAPSIVLRKIVGGQNGSSGIICYFYLNMPTLSCNYTQTHTHKLGLCEIVVVQFQSCLSGFCFNFFFFVLKGKSEKKKEVCGFQGLFPFRLLQHVKNWSQLIYISLPEFLQHASNAKILRDGRLWVKTYMNQISPLIASRPHFSGFGS